MRNIYIFSGPCGCGKSTLTNAYAEHLVRSAKAEQVYVIHGDDFHKGFVEKRPLETPGPDFLHWPDILRFNWDCILSVAGKALDRDLDVVIDYVVEDELPLLKQLAKQHDAKLFYVVLTASKAELRQRLIGRGSSELIERSFFLKRQLEHASENQGHLYCISGKTMEEEIRDLDISCYEVREI